MKDFAKMIILLFCGCAGLFLFGCKSVDNEIAEDVEPSISVVSPGGGENLEAGSKYTITWTSEKVFEDVMIGLCQPSGDCEVIDSSAPNTGSYDWIISSDRVASFDNKIEITGDSHVSGKGEFFSISSDYVAEDHGSCEVSPAVDSEMATSEYFESGGDEEVLRSKSGFGGDCEGDVCFGTFTIKDPKHDGNFIYGGILGDAGAAAANYYCSTNHLSLNSWSTNTRDGLMTGLFPSGWQVQSYSLTVKYISSITCNVYCSIE